MSNDYYKQYITDSDAMRARGEPVPPYREWLEGQLAIAHSLLEDARREIDDREDELAVYRQTILVDDGYEVLDRSGGYRQYMLDRDEAWEAGHTALSYSEWSARNGKPLTTSGGGA